MDKRVLSSLLTCLWLASSACAQGLPALQTPSPAPQHLSLQPEPVDSPLNTLAPTPVAFQMVEKPANFEFERLKASWSDKWDSWEINGSQGSLKADWSDKISGWSYRLPTGKGEIDADWSDKWNAWTLKAGTKRIRIKANWSDKWNDWQISGPTGDLRVKANWSDKWNDWNVSGKGGSMRIKANWSDKWNDWQIDDGMPAADPDLKMAAAFACMISAYVATHPSE